MQNTDSQRKKLSAFYRHLYQVNGVMEQFLRHFQPDIDRSLQVIDFLVYSHSV